MCTCRDGLVTVTGFLLLDILVFVASPFLPPPWPLALVELNGLCGQLPLRHTLHSELHLGCSHSPFTRSRLSLPPGE